VIAAERAISDLIDAEANDVLDFHYDGPGSKPGTYRIHIVMPDLSTKPLKANGDPDMTDTGSDFESFLDRFRPVHGGGAAPPFVDRDDLGRNGLGMCFMIGCAR
jgi:hypothetical protein